MNSLTVTAMTTVNPLGRGLAATWDGLYQNRHGLRPNDFEDAAIDTWIGRVDGLEKEPLEGNLADFDCRNNRLAVIALRQDGFEQAVARARTKYGADRIGVLVGTTTSGILETEMAYRQRGSRNGNLPPTLRYRCTQNVFSVSDVARRHLCLNGPAASVSTACSSSAKVFASASRWIEAGLCDAVVTGGVDSLCLMTLYGFSSLGLLSDMPCRPCDVHRNGLSIGEAAGFALLERTHEADGDIVFLGYGESTDAYHMSTPHPEGTGAAAAMQQALQCAGLTPRDIDYVNMHGTGTQANDRAEDQAIERTFGKRTPCSSTKGGTGHTLGAAGIVEAILTIFCLRYGLLPGIIHTRQLDPDFRSRILLQSERRPVRFAMSNSFGFGGNNCSLIFGRTG
ncbi:3-oxoacyl-[acyl-carrier-protein] synthase II [Nitrospira sp. KM1]|uniref:beta-ketoacyl-[acyl-carrier-protein] synthase family protein n=1 Tax=Nitrospira sp. KM1 TaxID=1936990 RepID=UPI0013A793D3|nr:beta-ketoacyl-[acyl-carrier-protein] synthase family protein [Nitrospira sp. KM1]BCA55719.1 3-oxoacyl-[acyl-carrier-protein] synthase II [Nitrospira sp. KM1]